MLTNYFKYSLLLAITTFSFYAFPQNCQNVDFEEGTFNGWSGFTGYNPGGGQIAQVNVPGFVVTRHTIMSTPGFDPYSNGQLSVISPYGGSYSVRLGNDNVGAEAERLSKTILITPQNTSLVYEYAVVFEDPQHDIEDQPRFELNILDQNGNPIPDPCFNYSVTAASNLPGYQQGPDDVYFRVWTPVALDLSAYVGQAITVEFTTYDCAIGGHFGYAYFDARCTKLEIIKSNCDSNQVIISVPPGFVSYLWSTGATTQSIVLNNPPLGAEYSVTATSETGCQTTLSLVITGDSIPQPDFELLPLFCDDGSAVTLHAPPGFNTYLWSTGDTTSSTIILGPQLGDTISVQLSNGIYCPTVVEYIIDSLPANNPNAIIDYIQVCVNADSAYVIGPGGFSSYLWNTGQNTSNIIIHSPQVGDTLSLTAIPSAGCPSSYLYIINSIINGSQTTFIQSLICDSATNIMLNAGEGYQSYQWSTGQNSSAIYYANPQVGDTVTVSALDFNGCVFTSNFVIQQNQTVPDTTYNTINACAEIATYNLNAPMGYINYLWSNQTQGYHNVIQNPQNGQQLYVQMTSNDGCKAYSAYSFNLVDNFPDDLEITTGQFCKTTKTLDITAPSGYNAYIWSNGNYGQTIQVTSPQAGQQYYVIVYDNLNCSDTVFVDLGYNNLPANMTLDKSSNVFTPNNDGYNDDFGVEAENYQFYDLRIYNRWGTLVFTSDSDTKHWTGNVNGQPAPESVYYYIFKVKACGIDKVVERHGSVTLLRDK